MKDKIYYFQEKSNDILDLQDDFTIEEIGILFVLKAAYFKYAGELKEDNLCQRCKFFGDKEKLMMVASKLFESKEGLLINNAWLSEIKNIKERSIKRQEAAKARWDKEEEGEPKPKQTQNNPNKPNGLSDKELIESQFEEFWNLYDYKKSKPKALIAFNKSIKSDSFENIIVGVNAYIQSRGIDKQYWKHPTTWLNAEAWKDEYVAAIKTENDICLELNKMIGKDWFKEIDVVDNQATFTISKANYELLKNSDQALKDKISDKIKNELQVSTIRPKYL